MTFEQTFQSVTSGFYSVLDRIVIRGYISALQRENSLVYFLKNICGVDVITPQSLKRFTEIFINVIQSFADKYNIPILTLAKGVRKHDYAQELYDTFEKDEGVFLILKSFETASTYASYQPKRKTKDPNYRKITRANRQVNHYYFYLKDRSWGLCCIRICSYLPFNVMIYLNGHHYVETMLKQSDVDYSKQDNCFVRLSDFDQAQALCDTVTAPAIQSFADRWLPRLFQVFSKQQKQQMRLSHCWSISQIEYCHNLIFHESAALDQLFERLTDQNRRIGCPDRISMIFDKRITARYHGRLQTSVDSRHYPIPVIKSWYKKSFIKQYAKNGIVLRSELCVNDTYDIDIRRSLENLPHLVEKAQAIMRRYLDAIDTILLSFVDRGIAYALAETTVAGNRRIPGIKLDNRRLMAVLEAVKQYSNLVDGFTNQILRGQVARILGIPVQEYSSSQMQYDLSKLRAKGLVEKKPRRNQYVLTRVGFQVCVLIAKLRRFILEPLLSGINELSCEMISIATNILDQSYANVDNALCKLCDVVGIKLQTSTS